MPSPELFDSLAALLCYPDDSYMQSAEACQRVVRAEQPELCALFECFHRRISTLSTEHLQELFTGTFDLNPICSPEVGWHLFGEQYERGEFLVRMRQQMRRFGIPETTELPDHIAHILSVLGRMDAEEAKQFAGACVFPALDKMREGLADTENPFGLLLDIITRMLETRCERPAAAAPQRVVLRVIQDRRPT